jgi:hypothetical protein
MSEPTFELNGQTVSYSTDAFVAMLIEVKHQHPDIRIGQFICAALIGEALPQLYDMEDQELVKRLREKIFAPNSSSDTDPLHP